MVAANQTTLHQVNLGIVNNAVLSQGETNGGRAGAPITREFLNIWAQPQSNANVPPYTCPSASLARECPPCGSTVALVWPHNMGCDNMQEARN